MTAILFVHGTGIRRAVFDQAFSLIQRQTGAIGMTAEPCYWGDLGARLSLQGASVPGYATHRGLGEPETEDSATAVWPLLLDDPLFILRLKALQGSPKRMSAGFSGEAPGDYLQAALANLRPNSEALSEMEQGGIASYFEAARREVITSQPYLALRSKTADPEADLADVIQAIVAQAVIKAQEAQEEQTATELPSGPPLAADSDRCQALVDLLTSTALATQAPDDDDAEWADGSVGERGVALDFVRKAAVSLASGFGTRYVRRRRGAVTDAASPFPADIIFYQARGERIRQRIQRDIQAAAEQSGEPVVVLGHSLGGVACVDLLIETDLREYVRFLVTAGSQAPLFYEMDMLRTLPVEKPLPGHFPRWLNLYDTRDFLSYIGDGVFPGRVTDIEVDNQHSFPDAHSAYWNNPHVWQEIHDALTAP